MNFCLLHYEARKLGPQKDGGKKFRSKLACSCSVIVNSHLKLHFLFFRLLSNLCCDLLVLVLLNSNSMRILYFYSTTRETFSSGTCIAVENMS